MASRPAQADRGSAAGAGAVAVIGVVGGVGAAGAAAHTGLLAFELDDWKEPGSGTTLKLHHQCDANLEFRLIGTHRNNYLMIGVVNESPNDRVLKPETVKMIFGNGRERAAAFPVEVSSVDIKGRVGKAIGYVPFPAKEDFAKQSRLTVQVPFFDKEGRTPRRTRIRPPNTRRGSRSPSTWGSASIPTFTTRTEARRSGRATMRFPGPAAPAGIGFSLGGSAIPCCLPTTVSA